MINKPVMIQEAEFSPNIKKYILFLVGFFMAITLIGIPLLLIWFLGVGQIISKRYYENLKCNLTNQHLEFKKGVFFMVEKTIPLENIQDLTFITNPLLNYLDLRILKVETAGHSNSNGSDMKLVGIIEAQAFKKRVLAQRELLRLGSGSQISNDINSNEMLDVLKDIRTLLKDIKKD